MAGCIYSTYVMYSQKYISPQGFIFTGGGRGDDFFFLSQMKPWSWYSGYIDHVLITTQVY